MEVDTCTVTYVSYVYIETKLVKFVKSNQVVKFVKGLASLVPTHFCLMQCPLFQKQNGLSSL